MPACRAISSLAMKMSCVHRISLALHQQALFNLVARKHFACGQPTEEQGHHTAAKHDEKREQNRNQQHILLIGRRNA